MNHHFVSPSMDQSRSCVITDRDNPSSDDNEEKACLKT